MVGGVIWGGLSEIQLLELWNPTTSPCTVWTLYEHELSNFFGQLISDRAQNFGNIWIWWEELFGDFWEKSYHYNRQSQNHSVNVTSFLRTWSVQYLWPIDFGLISKLGQEHNIVGGVIWWVLSQIQSLELCSPPTTPFTVQTSYGTNFLRT